jgi:hypothetical protein
MTLLCVTSAFSAPLWFVWFYFQIDRRGAEDAEVYAEKLYLSECLTHQSFDDFVAFL